MSEVLAQSVPELAELIEAERRFQVCGASEELVVEMARLIDRLQLKHGQAIAAVVDELAGDWDGDHTPTIWLREAAHLSFGAACDRMAVGQAAGRLGGAVEALEGGEIGFAHLAHMAHVALEVGEGFEEGELLARARRQDISKFRKSCEHYRHAQNPQWYAEQERRNREGRQLVMTPQGDGAVYLRGWLEPEGASLVRAALEPLAAPAGRCDDRTRKQRLGDALVELAGRGVRAELLITMPVETFLGLRGAPAAQTQWGGLLSSELVRRYQCHATLRRVVMDGRSVVIDLGRSHRLVTPEARKALVARDGECVWPGCDRPIGWCETHHLEPWRRGGVSDLGQMVSLCTRHHARADEGWSVIRNEAGDWMVIPPHPFWDGSEAVQSP